ncbi:ABC-type multidrug transport system, ATPase component [Gracilibacillus ureilyticus]|uniref:ABC-type multidrug transport system, ATPase component n=1 Tax=Gracilibacillus ureilyticus TaxID=531814 RepID=A0A1H9VXQ8_9BACI|nr:ABC transporter ATP-binding protein [Gracilibacillus ureilyticus]SES26301.1 ABC-type multidrug transport system, ATPase component [Gracilibacillus ureilyticus]
MLKVNQLSKKFKRRIALDETNFILENGTIGLLGPNGAGKTTLLRILATYYEPTSGSIKLNGKDYLKNREIIRQMIGYMPQNIGLFPQLKVKEFLSYIGLMRGIERNDLSGQIDKILQEVNLDNKSNVKITSLSGGMKQRVGIAQAIMHDPQLLLVDEPTAGLDPEERMRFRNLIKKLAQNRIVVFSTHITEDIAMTCDKVLLIKKGIVSKCENIHDVTNLASGKVWSLAADIEAYNRIAADSRAFISQVSEQNEDQIVNCRIIAEEQPHPSAKQAFPNLEEGYMVWLQGN